VLRRLFTVVAEGCREYYIMPIIGRPVGSLARHSGRCRAKSDGEYVIGKMGAQLGSELRAGYRFSGAGLARTDVGIA